MNVLGRLRRAPRLAIIVTVAMLGAVGAVAYAADGPSTLGFVPKYESQVTNIDVLRSQIKNYYGDPGGTGVFAPDSNYANEARSVAAEGTQWLAARAKVQNRAIVLDVDDTTLATWNYEIFSNWAYNPTSNAVYVNGQLFPAVPGMVDLVTEAANEGYAVFFITGRPTAQEPATLGNLTRDGIGVDADYPTPTTLNDGEDGLFTKPPTVADYPPYLVSACAGDPGGKCTTIDYKSATRAHIESLGYEIVADFGDQYSDLVGGFADKTFKLPNPNYYLP